MKKNKRIIAILISILIAILICIFVYLFLLFNTKVVLKTAMTKVINDTYGIIADINNVDFIKKNTNKNLNKRVLLNASYEKRGNSDTLTKILVDIINNINITSDISKTGKQTATKTSFAYKEEEIFNVTNVVNSNNAYYKIDGVHDKFICKEYYPMQNATELSIKECKYVINETSKIVTNTLNKESLYCKLDKLTYEEKTYSTVKHTIEVSKEKQKDIAEKIYNKIINDEKYRDATYKIYGRELTKEKYLETIKKQLADIDTLVFDYNFKINLYINPLTTKLVKLDVEMSKAETVEKLEVYTGESKARDIKIRYLKDDDTSNLLEIKKIDDNNYVWIYSDKYRKINTKITMNEKLNIIAEVYLNNEFETKIDIDVFEENQNIKGIINVEKKEAYNLKLNISTVDTKETLKITGLNDSINAKDVTKEEMNNYSAKLAQKFSNSKLGKEIVRLMLSGSLDENASLYPYLR